MQEVKPFEEIDEKALEVIINFRVQPKYDKLATNEILKLREDIKKAISLLPPDRQEIFKLRYYENLSSEAIAQRLNKSEQEIKQILQEGISNIKRSVSSGFSEVVRTQKTNETKTPQTGKKQIVQGVRKEVRANFKSATGRKIPVFLRLINIVVSIGFWLLIYFFVQKYFFTQLPTVGQLANNTSSFVAEKVISPLTGSKIPYKESRSAAIKEDPRSINISGSTSLLTLSKRLEDAFKRKHPQYKASLIPSDSKSGIDALIKGRIDIANSSRPVTYFDQTEAAKRGLELVEHRVAIDALIVFTNSKNPVDELSLDDLESIFSGENKDWVPYVREKGSGTNDFVLSRILQRDVFPSSIQVKNSNEGLIKSVTDNIKAISFINSANYPHDNPLIKFLKIKTYEDSPSASPFDGKMLNEQAMRYGDYPLAHYLYLITLSEPKEKVRRFIDWVLGLNGQVIVKNLGLIPVVEEE